MQLVAEEHLSPANFQMLYVYIRHVYDFSMQFSSLNYAQKNIPVIKRCFGSVPSMKRRSRFLRSRCIEARDRVIVVRYVFN